MAKRRPHRSKKDQPTEEQLVAEHRRRCRGPEWWSQYSDAELDQMQSRGQRLVADGFGSADPQYAAWLVALWKQK